MRANSMVSNRFRAFIWPEIRLRRWVWPITVTFIFAILTETIQCWRFQKTMARISKRLGNRSQEPTARSSRAATIICTFTATAIIGKALTRRALSAVSRTRLLPKARSGISMCSTHGPCIMNMRGFPWKATRLSKDISAVLLSNILLKQARDTRTANLFTRKTIKCIGSTRPRTPSPYYMTLMPKRATHGITRWITVRI